MLPKDNNNMHGKTQNISTTFIFILQVVLKIHKHVNSEFLINNMVSILIMEI